VHPPRQQPAAHHGQAAAAFGLGVARVGSQPQQLDHAIYVVEGTVVFTVEQRQLTAPAGSFALLPHGIAHTFANQATPPWRGSWRWTPPPASSGTLSAWPRRFLPAARSTRPPWRPSGPSTTPTRRTLTRGRPGQVRAARRHPATITAASSGRLPALIDRGAVGVAVDDLPLAVLAAVEVGDTQGNRRDRAAVYGDGEVVVANGAFDGALLFALGHDGPYLLQDLVIEDVATLTGLARGPTYTTAAYLHTDFQRPPLLLTGNASDHGAHTVHMERLPYEELVVEVEVDTAVAADVEATANLHAQDGTFVAPGRTFSSLAPGLGMVAFHFRASQIFFGPGKPGPYTLQLLIMWGTAADGTPLSLQAAGVLWLSPSPTSSRGPRPLPESVAAPAVAASTAPRPPSSSAPPPNTGLPPFPPRVAGTAGERSAAFHGPPGTTLSETAGPIVPTRVRRRPDCSLRLTPPPGTGPDPPRSRCAQRLARTEWARRRPRPPAFSRSARLLRWCSPPEPARRDARRQLAA
jgi:hypothetical protein